MSTTQRYNIGIWLVKCFGIFLFIIFVSEDLLSKHKDEFIICEAVALVLPNLHRMMANGRWQFNWIAEAILKLPEDLLMPDEYQGW